MLVEIPQIAKISCSITCCHPTCFIFLSNDQIGHIKYIQKYVVIQFILLLINSFSEKSLDLTKSSSSTESYQYKQKLFQMLLPQNAYLTANSGPSSAPTVSSTSRSTINSSNDQLTAPETKRKFSFPIALHSTLGDSNALLSRRRFSNVR